MRIKALGAIILASSLMLSGCGKKDLITHERASEAMLDFYLECLEAEKSGETIEIVIDGTNRLNNLGFLNVSGMTIADEAEEARMTMEYYRETFKIPERIFKNITSARRSIYFGIVLIGYSESEQSYQATYSNHIRMAFEVMDNNRVQIIRE